MILRVGWVSAQRVTQQQNVAIHRKSHTMPAFRIAAYHLQRSSLCVSLYIFGIRFVGLRAARNPTYKAPRLNCKQHLECARVSPIKSRVRVGYVTTTPYTLIFSGTAFQLAEACFGPSLIPP